MCFFMAPAFSGGKLSAFHSKHAAARLEAFEVVEHALDHFEGKKCLKPRAVSNPSRAEGRKFVKNFLPSAPFMRAQENFNKSTNEWRASF
jgi:hypothetical protein